jgi:hypothetical protein
MTYRGLFVLAVLFAVTAFAPAPLPRTPRRKAADEISAATFQGRWRITGMWRTSSDGKHVPYPASASHVRIKEDVWSFEYEKGGHIDQGTLFAIDGTKRPAAHLDFWRRGMNRQQPPVGGGVIRKKGDVVEIIYIFGKGNVRPVSFEQPPDGQYWLTLQSTE